MTVIVKAADAAQFLSLVPQLLGYTPRDSVVLVPFARSRSLGAMRFDLPLGDTVDAFAATAIGMVCRIANADAVTVAVFCDGEAGGGEGPPAQALAEALRSRADACGIRVSDALWQTAQAWGSYLDGSAPTGGHDLSALRAPDTGLGVPDADQSSGAALPVAGDDERAAVLAALRQIDRAARVLLDEPAIDAFGLERSRVSADGADARIDPSAFACIERLDDLPAFFDDVLRTEPDDADAQVLALLTWCLRRPALRDIGLVTWSSGFAAGDEALDAQLRWEAGEPYPVHLAQRIWGEGERPDADRLRRALSLVRLVAAAAPERLRAGALSTCAWLSWALGGSTHAAEYAQAAVALEPEHGLSEIVLSMVDAGHLPDWAFDRRRSGGRRSRRR